MKELPIFCKTYDFMKWLLLHTIKFPKSQRFVLAKRIEDTFLNFYELLIAAVKSKDKLLILINADIELEKVKVYLRLCTDLKLISIKQYEYATREISEIGKILGAWLKKIKRG